MAGEQKRGGWRTAERLVCVAVLTIVAASTILIVADRVYALFVVFAGPACFVLGASRLPGSQILRVTMMSASAIGTAIGLLFW